MSDPANWTVRELKVFLHSNGISTAGMKDKRSIISLASSLLEEQQRELYTNICTALVVIAITAVFWHKIVRPKVERYFWLNPNWVGSYIVVHLLFVLDKLLTINVILSWIVPANLKQYNVIDLYVVTPLKLFPLCVPLNIDEKSGEVLMWLDLYPMFLIWSIRYLTRYWTLNYHYMWYDQWKDGYFDAYPDATRPDLDQMMNAIHQELNAVPNFEVEIERNLDNWREEEGDIDVEDDADHQEQSEDKVVGDHEGDHDGDDDDEEDKEGNDEEEEDEYGFVDGFQEFVEGFEQIVDEFQITPNSEFDDKLQRALSELMELNSRQENGKVVDSEE